MSRPTLPVFTALGIARFLDLCQLILYGKLTLYVNIYICIALMLLLLFQIELQTNAECDVKIGTNYFECSHLY